MVLQTIKILLLNAQDSRGGETGRKDEKDGRRDEVGMDGFFLPRQQKSHMGDDSIIAELPQLFSLT